MLDAYNAQLKRMMNGADLSSVNLEHPCKILFIFNFTQGLKRQIFMIIVSDIKLYANEYDQVQTYLRTYGLIKHLKIYHELLQI